MLTIYGWKRSRAIRCMWVLEELGLEYEHVPLNPHAGETRTPEYLALNPSGKIPTLVHDGFVLTECMAINAYLASTHPGSLWPGKPQDVATTWQWTSWALSELEPLIVAIMREGRRPADSIDTRRIEAWRSDVNRLLDVVLEPHFGRNTYALAGSGFTLADLNLASVVSNMRAFDMDLTKHPRTDEWVQRCLSRPAWVRLQKDL
jgi:glutathione S-transferase